MRGRVGRGLLQILKTASGEACGGAFTSGHCTQSLWPTQRRCFWRATETPAPSKPIWQTHGSCSSQYSAWQVHRTYQDWRTSRTAYEQAKARSKKGSKDSALYLVALAIGMLGAAYGSVPLYRLYCSSTGYGGTVQEGQSVEEKIRKREEQPNEELEKKAAQREITVWFNADVAEGMPWRFKPTQPYVKIKPGESTLIFYTAENRSDTPITGVSTYMVVPERAAYYFNKIQCFCFEEQRLQAGEVVDMPVFFYIDPEFVEDASCRNIDDLTLSYTFFRVEDEEEDEDAMVTDGEARPVGVRTHGPGPIGPGQQLIRPPSVAAAAG